MKTKTPALVLTAAEAEVINVVWDSAPVAVADVVERLPRTLAYTTVMTTMRILEEKGFIVQCGKRGRAFLYEAALDRDRARGGMSQEIADRLFGGSIKSLVLSLVQGDAISDEDLAEVKQLIAQLEAAK
jgi:BlaI family penicillinase repressor